jgi:hypothetical protein
MAEDIFWGTKVFQNSQDVYNIATLKIYPRPSVGIQVADRNLRRPGDQISR